MTVIQLLLTVDTTVDDHSNQELAGAEVGITRCWLMVSAKGGRLIRLATNCTVKIGKRLSFALLFQIRKNKNECKNISLRQLNTTRQQRCKCLTFKMSTTIIILKIFFFIYITLTYEYNSYTFSIILQNSDILLLFYFLICCITNNSRKVYDKLERNYLYTVHELSNY